VVSNFHNGRNYKFIRTNTLTIGKKTPTPRHALFLERHDFESDYEVKNQTVTCLET